MRAGGREKAEGEEETEMMGGENSRCSGCEAPSAPCPFTPSPLHPFTCHCRASQNPGSSCAAFYQLYGIWQISGLKRANSSAPSGLTLSPEPPSGPSHLPSLFCGTTALVEVLTSQPFRYGNSWPTGRWSLTLSHILEQDIQLVVSSLALQW